MDVKRYLTASAVHGAVGQELRLLADRHWSSMGLRPGHPPPTGAVVLGLDLTTSDFRASPCSGHIIDWIMRDLGTASWILRAGTQLRTVDFLETGSHYVVQGGLELVIPLPLPPKRWAYR